MLLGSILECATSFCMNYVWKVLTAAPVTDRVRKNLEASFIALSRPSLNEQIDSKKLILFRNGVVTRQFYLF